MPPAAASTARCPTSSPTRGSFASRLRRIIDVRRAHGIATAIQVDVPDVSHRGELVMVHRLADERTAADHRAELLGRARSPAPCAPSTCRRASAITDMFTGEPLGTVDDLHSFSARARALRGHLAAALTA